MLTLDSPAFQELRRDFNEWLPAIIDGADKFIPAHPLMGEGGEPISMRRVIEKVADVSGLDVAALLSHRRSPEVAHPRQIAMALVRELCTTVVLKQVASEFKRDRSCITHAVRVVRDRLGRGDRRTVKVYRSAKAELLDE